MIMWISMVGLSLCLGALVGYLVGKNSTKNDRSSFEELLRQETAAKVRIEELEKRLTEQKQNFSETTQELFQRFQTLSHKMLDENTEKIRKRSEEGIGSLLKPLKEKLQDFEKKVQNTYETEARERFALKEEIKRIAEINQKMTNEASNLTKALKGDVKTQGNWGEIILERILESSGLREGEEYILQGKDLKLDDHDGNSLRPDAIINLPDDKHLIIDSKVSLISFEKLSNSEKPEEQEVALKEFFTSVDSHVRNLSDKHYANARGVNSPDFVFLFMPIETAFLTYARENKEGFSKAWERKIMIVGPSTLWPCLRTVASLWKTERQNQNTLKIAQHAGSLYDKFANFVLDLEKIGKSISDAQNNYDAAVSKLKDGRGNLLSQTEKLRELGAKTKKKLELEQGSAE